MARGLPLCTGLTLAATVEEVDESERCAVAEAEVQDVVGVGVEGLAAWEQRLFVGGECRFDVVGVCGDRLGDPPGYGHGGMSAMLLDELMGQACTAAGTPGLTVSLQMRYHQPIPLETPLRILGRVTRTDNRKIFVTGRITTQADPSTHLVTADGVFITPDPDRARALFPGLQEET